MSLPFGVPAVQDNPDAWGPSTLPEHLKDVPFAPFGKGDKLGRASDWTQAAYQKYPGRFQNAAPTNVFNFFHNEEEESFHLVDNRPVKTNKFGGRGGGRFQQNRFQAGRGRGDDKNKQQDDKKKQQQQKKNPWQGNYQRDNQRMPQYTSSVEIRPEWAVVEQIPFPSLAKLSCSVPEPENLAECGQLEYYDKSVDRVTLKSEKALERTKRVFRSVSTSDDPIIRDLAAQGKARVFATDNILTTLMCMKSSVYSWDIVVTKANDKLFFDWREGSNLNMLTVNETAPEAVQEDKDNINGVQHLSLEATAINQNFSQQALVKDGEKYEFSQPNPFTGPDEQDELASCAYRYRKWRLNDEDDVDIVVRCEVDGVINNKGELQLLSIKALNEFDLKGQDWRKKIEQQRAAVLLSETKNNKNKMAKWTAGAMLAGADMIKLGFISRVTPKDNQNHVILGTQQCKPKEFAGQINLSMDHCWGIVRALVDMLLKQPEGKYLLVKDPTKELLRLYALPDDALENNYVDEPLPQDEAQPIVPVAATQQAAAAADEDV